MPNKPALFSYHTGKINSLIICSVSEGIGNWPSYTFAGNVNYYSILEHYLTVPINLKNIQT